MCAQLVDALKPADYNILICSSFPAEPSQQNGNQVAILSRQKAYFSWSESFKLANGSNDLGGGFGFAAIQLPRQRLGVFSVALPSRASLDINGRPASDSVGGSADPVATEAQFQKILAQADAVKHWQLNQVQAVLLGISFTGSQQLADPERDHTIALLTSAGFADGLLLMPSEQRPTLDLHKGANGKIADYFFVDAAAFALNPKVVRTSFSDHFPITCDLETEPARAALLYREQADQVQAAAQSAARSRAQAAQSPQALILPWWTAATAGGFIAFLVLIWLARRIGKTARSAPLLLPETAQAGGPSAYTLVIGTSPATGSALDATGLSAEAPPMVRIEPAGSTQTQSAFWQQRALAAEQRAAQAQVALKGKLLPDLRRWLRQKLTRKLMADRAGLIQNQEMATRRVLNVDERLARIERQVQQQNRSYERRIEELTCELMAAKEENRELIRARIIQVRAEMEAARAKLLAEAEEPKAGAPVDEG